MTDRLDEIRARAEAATPGPWEARPRIAWRYKYTELSIQEVEEFEDSTPAFAGCLPLDKADAVFIAHAREDIPYLLAEVERLRAAAERAFGNVNARNETLEAEVERLRAERAFLAARKLAHATYSDERCWGLSSDWLAYSACGIDYPKREPSDPSDLMACWRTMKMAPPHIQERMEPPFYAWVEMICEKWPTAADEVRAAITEGDES